MRQVIREPDKQHGTTTMVATQLSGMPIGLAAVVLDLGHYDVKHPDRRNAADACALAASLK